MSIFFLYSSWLIPFYGLIGTLFSLPWSINITLRIGPLFGAYLNLLMSCLAFIHSSFAFILIWGKPVKHLAFDWLNIANLHLSLSVELSPISLGALELITCISFLSQVYALGYMEKDWSLARFLGMMGIFEASLGGIALSDSLLLSYGLLEILTLSTYLLVGFWYAQPLVQTAARDAFLTKRVGDIIFFMGLVALSSYGEGLTFSELETWALNTSVSTLNITLLGLSLIAGLTGKCAQFPLNLWLDKAMEGPNPASIMRNSIVVSAGAYVLIKLQPLFALSSTSSNVLVILGVVTGIGTSLIAMAQIDIKRALCHSTSTYLGLVFIAAGLGHVDIAFLLIYAHSIPKALLFMSAGSVIFTTNSQNITEMGGLWSRMPVTTVAFLVGLTGLIASFPMGMFWTWRSWLDGYWGISPYLLVTLLIINTLCAFNLTRVFCTVFLGTFQNKTKRTPEVTWFMSFPMLVLIVFVLIEPIIPIRWKSELSPVFTILTNYPSVISPVCLLIIVSGLFGCLFGTAYTVSRKRSTNLWLYFFQNIFAHDFYLEQVYAVTVVSLVKNISWITSWFDSYIVDGLNNLISYIVFFSSSILKYSSSGQLQLYVLTICSGLWFSILVWFLFRNQLLLISNVTSINSLC